MEEVLKELQELKNLTLLGVKQALTMSDAALLTGLSKSHIYKLVCGKKVPYYKAHEGGKYTYFDKDELTAWMLGRRIKTDAEIEHEAANYVVNGRLRPAVPRTDVTATLKTSKRRGHNDKKSDQSRNY